MQDTNKNLTEIVRKEYDRLQTTIGYGLGLFTFVFEMIVNAVSWTY
jgi:hypothetical protein